MSDVNAALLLLALRQQPSPPASEATMEAQGGPENPHQMAGSPSSHTEERKFRVYVPGEETFKLPISKGTKRSFECHHCGRVFVRREHRQRHIETMHQGAKDFKCELCMRVFSRKDNMMQHVRNKHGKIKLLAESGKVNQQLCLTAKPQVPAALRDSSTNEHDGTTSSMHQDSSRGHVPLVSLSPPTGLAQPTLALGPSSAPSSNVTITPRLVALPPMIPMGHGGIPPQSGGPPSQITHQQMAIQNGLPPPPHPGMPLVTGRPAPPGTYREYP